MVKADESFCRHKGTRPEEGSVAIYVLIFASVDKPKCRSWAEVRNSGYTYFPHLKYVLKREV